MALSGALLAQVSQAVAQAPEVSPTMDFLEFLGTWNEDEENLMDSMLVDRQTDSDHPVREHATESSLLDPSQENVEGPRSSTPGEEDFSLHDDE